MEKEGSASMGLLKERAENYTADEFGEIHSMDAHLVRNLEGYLFPSSDEGRPCTVIGGKGTGKTFNLIKTLRRGVRELESFHPVMFVFKKTGEIEMLDISLLTPSSSSLPSKLEKVDSREAMVMADAIVFDDFHYVCEAIERGDYPPSKLIEFLKDILSQVKLGKKVIISSADQLSAYSDVVDDPEYDRILLEYGFGEDAEVDALARLEVSFSSFRAWKTIAKGLGIEASDIVLRFVHRCDPNPRKPADEVEVEEDEEPETPEFIDEKEEEVQKAERKKGSSSQRVTRSETSRGSVWEELERELNEEQSEAPTWQPSEPGDQILGEVIRTGKGPNGRLLEIKTPNGENYILWEKVALKDLFDRANAGDKIGVRFLGKEESASGRSYYNFRTAIRK